MTVVMFHIFFNNVTDAKNKLIQIHIYNNYNIYNEISAIFLSQLEFLDSDVISV